MKRNGVNLRYNHIRGEIYRNIDVNLFGKTKYDDLFWETYYQLDATHSWGYEKFLDYQMQELQKQIKNAYQNTIYYRRLFDENGWRPSQFQDFKDIRKIPIMTKKEIKEHFRELRALPKGKCYITTTGGSTGIPTKIYYERSVTGAKYSAFVWQWYNEGGYYLGDKATVIRGGVIEDGCCEILRKSNELHCSSMRMSEHNMKIYLDNIERYGTKAICAYPSSAELLARYVKESGYTFNETGKIKILFTSSENLTNRARKLIQKYLHVRVLDLYGNSEQMGMIGQLKDGYYHEYMCHSYVEYLDEKNEPIQKGVGKIIATGLINAAMPILRYDTNDYAFIEVEKHNMYNEQKTVKYIQGKHRKDELIVGKEDNLVNLVAINSHLNIFDHIYKMQYIQEEKGKIKLNIMPNQNFTQNDKNCIYHEFKSRLGDTFELMVNETNEFECTERGKSKLLVQKLSLSDYVKDK